MSSVVARATAPVVGGWSGGDVVGVVGVGDDGFVLVDGEVDGLDVAEASCWPTDCWRRSRRLRTGPSAECSSRSWDAPASPRLHWCSVRVARSLVNPGSEGFFLSGSDRSGIRSGSSSAAMSPNGSLSAFAATVMMSSPNGVDSCGTSPTLFSSAASLVEVSE